jgi:hypothetical protein
MLKKVLALGCSSYRGSNKISVRQYQVRALLVVADLTSGFYKTAPGAKLIE